MLMKDTREGIWKIDRGGRSWTFVWRGKIVVMMKLRMMMIILLMDMRMVRKKGVRLRKVMRVIDG